MKILNLAMTKLAVLSVLLYSLTYFMSSTIYGMYSLMAAGLHVKSLLISAIYIVPGIVYSRKASKKIKKYHHSDFEKEHTRLTAFIMQRRLELVLTALGIAILLLAYRMIPIEVMTQNPAYYLFYPLILAKILIEPIAHFTFFSAFSFGKLFLITPWIVELLAIYTLSRMVVMTRNLITSIF